MKGSNSLNRPIAGLIAGAVLLGSGWLWWLCRCDSRIPFLPEAGPAEWIVYPKPPDTTPHLAKPLWAVFRRTFTLPAAPATASLSVRAFKQGAVHINGQLLGDLPLREQDWKSPHTIEAVQFLHAGENEISVTVSNSLGPPALWLSLEGDAQALNSDPSWQVSLVGAAWQPAALASAPPTIRPGNQLFGRELMTGSLRRTWPTLLLILLISTAAIGACHRILRPERAAGAARGNRLALVPAALLGVIVIAWIALFSNNLPQLAPLFGFDRDGHQQYIDYLLQKKALPLADAGWQMYQPPLFYLLSALIIGPFGWPATADSAVLTLRAFSAITGIVHLVLLFQCLRLMFPNQPRQQIVGLLLAGFLPMNLCLSHHITNESLAALFVTAALYFSLRLLRAGTRAEGLAIAVGVCLGLALLTKFSVVLAVPFVLGALAWRRAGTNPAGKAVTSVSLVLVSLLAVCGWHFARVWHRFGTPLIGNWDPSLPFAWWQDPGYHTGQWYCRFGDSLVCPLFSSITSFADGVYSTLWGDGLCSGAAVMSCRPQWHYDLMNAGYLLGWLGTVLLITGGLVFLWRFLRQPTAEKFLILGLVFGFGAGIALMTLRVASYAQVKAFYALPALLPACVLAVNGWDCLWQRSRILRPLLGIGLLAWAMTAYAAFWIRWGDPLTYTARGVNLADDGRQAEAAEEFAWALRLDTNSLPARVGLAEALNHLGRHEEAWQQTTLALQQHPEATEAHTQAAAMLGRDGRYDEAVTHLRQALTRAPDHPTAYEQLAACLARAGRQQEVQEACEQGLRVNPFNPNLHHSLAVVSAEIGDLTNAIIHLRLALEFKPKWPAALSLLALTLASTGQLDEAAEQYQRAIQAKPDDPKLRYTYALTLGIQGKAREAADQYRQVLQLQPDHVEALNNLAWILATSPMDDVRNGAEAVRLGERACNLTQQGEPVLLGTLAAAYAEAGRFAEAVQAAEKARGLAQSAGQKEVAEKNRKLLELYRNGQPYHDPGGGSR